MSEDIQEKNYKRLFYVYFEAAPCFLRQVFAEYWSLVESQEWQNNKISGQKLLAVPGLKSLVAKAKSQRQSIETGNSNLWDLSLLSDILILLKKEHPNAVLGSVDLSSFSKKNLEWLKSTRNKLAHSGSMKIETSLFEKLWEETEKVLSSMGMSSDLLESKSNSSNVDKIYPNSKEAEEFKLKGNDYFNKQQYKEAVAEYTKGIELESVPLDLLGVLYSNRSICYLCLGAYSGAKEDAQSVITLRPSWFRGYSRLGSALEKMQKYKKAVNYFKLAIQFGDPSASTVDKLQYCIVKSGKEDRFVATDPDLTGNKFFNADVFQTVLTDLSFIYTTQCLEYPDYMKGLQFLNGEGGIPQDYFRAAECFTKAAQAGSSLGIVNLAVLMREGKGVTRNIPEAHGQLLRAAELPLYREVFPGSGIECIDAGVSNAYNYLGLAYNFEIGVIKDKPQALKWFKLAALAGNCAAANNVGMLLDESPIKEEYEQCRDYWKLSAYLETIRAMENLARNFYNASMFKEAQEWYHYALHKGSIDFKAFGFKYVKDRALELRFNPDEFYEKLKTDLRSGSLSEEFIRLENMFTNVRRLYGSPLNHLQNAGKSSSAPNNKERNESCAFSKSSKDRHRLKLTSVKLFGNLGTGFDESFGDFPSKNLMTSSDVDLVGLREIFVKEIVSKSGRTSNTFKGTVLKLFVIDEEIRENSTVDLLTQDSRGSIICLQVNNYVKKKNPLDNLGYGCRLSLINPSYNQLDELTFGLRVDDPDLILNHKYLRDANICRYCLKESGTIECKHCHVYKYCSATCLEQDYVENKHWAICKRGEDGGYEFSWTGRESWCDTDNDDYTDGESD